VFQVQLSDESNNQTASSKKPSHIAYQVREGKGEKGYFTRIGALPRPSAAARG